MYLRVPRFADEELEGHVQFLEQLYQQRHDYVPGIRRPCDLLLVHEGEDLACREVDRLDHGNEDVTEEVFVRWAGAEDMATDHHEAAHPCEIPGIHCSRSDVPTSEGKQVLHQDFGNMRDPGDHAIEGSRFDST